MMNRAMALIAIISLGLVSCACGELTVSFSSGDSSGISGLTETFGAETDDKIHEQVSLSGSLLSDYIGPSSGNISKKYSVTNTAGDHAEVGLRIGSAALYSGSYKLSPDDVDYAKADMCLDVDSADSIYAFAYSLSRDGNNASSRIGIDRGSLAGYKSSAYSSLGYAETGQEVNSAIGDSVRFDGYALNNESRIDFGSWIKNGGIVGYKNSAYSALGNTNVSQEANSANGDYVYFGDTISNKGGQIESFVDVEKGSLEEYKNSAYSTTGYANAIQEAYKANGAHASFHGIISNDEGQIANRGSIIDGTITKYKNSAYSTLGYANASQGANSAEGDSVRFGWSGENKEGNILPSELRTNHYVKGYNNSVEAIQWESFVGTQSADFVRGNWNVGEASRDAGTSWDGTGSITNYEGQSETTSKSDLASASADNISGNMVLIADSNMDFLQPDHALSSTIVENGIVKNYSNGAISGLNEHSSYQKFDLFSPNSVIGDWNIRQYLRDNNGAAESDWSGDGSITDYEGHSEATLDHNLAWSSADSINGDWHLEEASLDYGDFSGKGGTIWDGQGSITNYEGQSEITSKSNLASASADSVSGSMELIADSNMDVFQPDHALSSTIVENGIIKSYSNGAGRSLNKGFTNQRLLRLDSDPWHIRQDSWSNNGAASSDWSGYGSITDYEGYSEATFDRNLAQSSADSINGDWDIEEMSLDYGDFSSGIGGTIWSGGGSITNYEGQSETASESNTASASADSISSEGPTHFKSNSNPVDMPDIISASEFDLMESEGSLFGYESFAYSSLGFSKTNQMADSIISKWWRVTEQASGYAGEYAISTGEGNGKVKNYQGNSEAILNSKYTSAVADSISGDFQIGANSLTDFHTDQQTASVSTAIHNGKVNLYSNEAKADITGPNTITVTGSQKFLDASGESISLTTNAENFRGNKANVKTEVMDGKILKGKSDWGYSDNSYATNDLVNSEAQISSTKKTSKDFWIEITSEVRNKKLCNIKGANWWERLDQRDMREEGVGLFDIRVSKELSDASISSTSTSEAVSIDASIPDAKTALILDPFSDDPTDPTFSDSVYIPLIGKGYATTYYYQSGVTLDKFQNWDKYNIILVVSHMEPTRIALSIGDPIGGITFPQFVFSGDITYSKAPPKDSLVLLAGCKSFGWSELPLTLADSVKQASVRGGYKTDAGHEWNQYSVGELFTKMAYGKGMKLEKTYNDVWTEFSADYDDPAKLVFYGDTNFKL